MKKFEYEFVVMAKDQKEADERMKAIITIMNKLSTEELKKVASVVSNPVQLAMVKSKLL